MSTVRPRRVIQHHVPGPSSRRRPSPVAAPRRVRVHPRRFSGRCAIRRTPRRVAARERSRCVTDARGRGRRDDRRGRADAVRRASDARAGDWLGADESAVTRRLGRIRRRFDAGRRRCGRGGARGGVDAAGTGPRVGGRTRGSGRGRIASREIEQVIERGLTERDARAIGTIDRTREGDAERRTTSQTWTRRLCRDAHPKT